MGGVDANQCFGVQAAQGTGRGGTLTIPGTPHVLPANETNRVEEGMEKELCVILAPALTAMAHPALIQRPLIEIYARRGCLRV